MEKKESTNKIERLLTELNVKYEKLEIDEDFNYMVFLNSKEINKRNIIFLLFYTQETGNLVVICPGIYTLTPKDSILSILSSINKANSKLSAGKLILEKDKQIVYKRIEQYKRMDQITKNVLINIFSDIIASIIYTTDEIKKIRKSNE